MSVVRIRFYFLLAALLCLALVASGCRPITPEAGTLPAPAPAAPAASDAAASFADAWQGTISVAGVELDFQINVTGTADDFTATMDIPQQGATGLPVHSIAVDGSDVTFAILEGAQQATFSGTFSDDPSTGQTLIQGTFVQAGQQGTFTLARVEAAPEQAAPAEGVTAGASGIDFTYADPAGLFTAPVPTGWTAEEHAGFVTLRDPDGEISVHLLAVPSDDLDAAVAAAWETVRPGFAVPVDQSMDIPPTEGIERILFINYGSDDDDEVIQAYAQLFDGVSYIQLYEATLTGAQRRQAQLTIIQTGFTILGQQRDDLSGRQPAAFTPEIAGQWEQFISDTLPLFDIPGAVIGVVQGGDLVYAQGFGYADPAQQTPITPQTHMMIGSTGKSLTTLLMATLVDDGLMEWDTPAQQLYPEFAVQDHSLSETITMRNLVCACTGVPRRDLEFLFNAGDLDAHAVIASLRDFEFFTGFGEAFQYSNQMVATGGYIAGHVAQPDAATLEAAYAAALQERVLAPIGMEHTTVSFDAVEEAGNFATPHGYTALAEYKPISLAVERTLEPIAPAGGHWSTLEDMAKYMVVQLGNGVAPDGARVVSEENLLVTRVPQVKISAEASYGLGWMIAQYKGLPMITHGGNTLGFTNDFTFFPSADLGILVMVNAQAANSFTGAVTVRLLELLYGLDAEAQQGVDFVVQEMARQREQLAASIGVLDVAAAEPFVGAYTNAALGKLLLGLEEGRLYADAGEFKSELWPRIDGQEKPNGYVFADPPLAGLPLRLEMGDDGAPSVVLGAGVTEYIFLPE